MVKRVLKNDVLEIFEDDTLVLMITETITENNMLMRLLGKIKSSVAFELEDELIAVLPFCKSVQLDMSHVKYISGNALESLLAVQKIADDSDVTITILNPSEEVKTVFDDCGFMDILEVNYTYHGRIEHDKV